MARKGSSNSEENTSNSGRSWRSSGGKTSSSEFKTSRLLSSPTSIIGLRFSSHSKTKQTKNKSEAPSVVNAVDEALMIAKKKPNTKKNNTEDRHRRNYSWGEVNSTSTRRNLLQEQGSFKTTSTEEASTSFRSLSSCNNSDHLVPPRRITARRSGSMLVTDVPTAVLLYGETDDEEEEEQSVDSSELKQTTTTEMPRPVSKNKSQTTPKVTNRRAKRVDSPTRSDENESNSMGQPRKPLKRSVSSNSTRVRGRRGLGKSRSPSKRSLSSDVANSRNPNDLSISPSGRSRMRERGYISTFLGSNNHKEEEKKPDRSSLLKIIEEMDKDKHGKGTPPSSDDEASFIGKSWRKLEKLYDECY
eukprot:scaffold4675_cov101-Cylindrotheca_fusiformis.AAC.3